MSDTIPTESEQETIDRLRRDDGDGGVTFDARHLLATENLEAAWDAQAEPIQTAALDDKHRLAELYYGGCPESPHGLTQAALGAYLDVSGATIGRRLRAFGIHAPECVRQARATAYRLDDSARCARMPANEPPDPERVHARRRGREVPERGESD